MNASFSRGRAVIIGIDEYQHVRRLPSIVINDALDVADFLCAPESCGYQRQRVTLLLGRHATKRAIIDAFQNLARAADTNDTVLIYFSGHGAMVQTNDETETYLLPVDCTLDRINASALHSSEISSLLSTIRSRRLIALLDTCHAGGAVQVKTVSGQRTIKLGLDDNTYERLSTGAGRIIIGSCLPHEVSWIHPGMRNSVFTHCLLQCLSEEVDARGDGLIRVMDLFHELTTRVPALEPRQHPVLKAVAEANFPIALRPRRAKKVEERFPHVDVVEDEWSRLEILLTQLYPGGPLDQAIWSRAGGDVARLTLGASGIAAWHDAIKKLRAGGGGPSLGFAGLLRAVAYDFPNNSAVRALAASEEGNTNASTQKMMISEPILAPSRLELRFVEIRFTGTTHAAISSPLAISEFPLTERDAPEGWVTGTPRRQTILLLDGLACTTLLQELSTAGLRVRLPTYEEWKFAMAARNQSPRSPHRIPDINTRLTVDRWARNEWGIGVPPVSVGEWLTDDTETQILGSAPAACIRVRGGQVSFTSRRRKIGCKLPVRLVLHNR
jgi:hypothetical protein